MLRPQGLTLAVASERVILTEHTLQLGPAWPVLCMDRAVGRLSCPAMGLSRAPSGEFGAGAALRSTTVSMKMGVGSGCQSRWGWARGAAPPPGPHEGLWAEGRPGVAWGEGGQAPVRRGAPVSLGTRGGQNPVQARSLGMGVWPC